MINKANLIIFHDIDIIISVKWITDILVQEEEALTYFNVTWNQWMYRGVGDRLQSNSLIWYCLLHILQVVYSFMLWFYAVCSGSSKGQKTGNFDSSASWDKRPSVLANQSIVFSFLSYVKFKIFYPQILVKGALLIS